MTTANPLARPSSPLNPNKFARQYIGTIAVVLLITLALFQLQGYLGDANISLLYLLLVLFYATTTRPALTIFCGAISFFCYDFFLLPPIFDVRPNSPTKLLDPAVFLVVAWVTSALAERSRQNAVEMATYQQASQFRTTLLHLISHNLRTPLATIKTALSSLLVSPDTAPRDLLVEADQECDRLNRLIGNVLQLSRLDAHAIRLHTDWNALDEVVSVVFSRWRTETIEKKLTASFPTTFPLVQFDFDLVESVLTNLIENALRHGRPPIRVLIELIGTEVRVCVQDVGPGIPVAQRKYLFQQFLTTNASGLGLGLAVCKGLVEAQGGRLWAEFQPGKTSFIFTLPLTVYQDDREEPDDTDIDR